MMEMEKNQAGEHLVQRSVSLAFLCAAPATFDLVSLGAQIGPGHPESPGLSQGGSIGNGHALLTIEIASGETRHAFGQKNVVS